MSPVSLASDLEQLEAIKRDARDLLSSLTDAQLNWKPKPDQWSIGECLSHLIVSGEAELPYLEHAITTGRERHLFGKEPFRYGVPGSWFVRAMDAPARWKFKAPRLYMPMAGAFGPLELMERFFSLQEQLVKCVQESEGLHLSKIRVATPVVRFVTFSLGQALALVLAHERRHLWQARQIKSRLQMAQPVHE